MGSFFKSKKAPAPPPPPAPKIVQDLINGVETVTETRDGKEYVITRQLPLTPEQQAIKDDITRRLDNLDKISEGLAIANPDFKPMVDAMRAWQQQTRGQMFGEAARAQSDELARRGLSNSTAAAQASTALSSQMGTQTQQDELSLFGLAEDLRAQQINRDVGNLQLRLGTQGDENIRLTNAGINTANTQANRLSLDSQIQQTNYQNQLNAFNAKKPSAFQSLLNTGVALGTAYLTGGGSLAFSNPFSSGASSSVAGAASMGSSLGANNIGNQQFSTIFRNNGLRTI